MQKWTAYLVYRIDMSFVNYHTKEINCKIVYYGPGLGGKTTNIQWIYQKTASGNKGNMVSLNTENERTLFFDFLPLDLGEIRGFKTRFHLYTVPGQVFYEASRKLILRGVDGIIFVADSQVERMEANLESLASLNKNLEDQGYNPARVPTVMQWNKRDLPNIVPVSDLSAKLNERKLPEFEASAFKGDGVFETLKSISKMVLLNIKGGLE
jgi:signal recognition particle receptor subunit beta